MAYTRSGSSGSSGCGGCNDGCLDESVQLQQGAQGEVGPAGPEGPAGEGVDGRDGTTVIEYGLTDLTINQNSFSTSSRTFTIPENTLNALGDHVEFEGMFAIQTFNDVGGIQFVINNSIVVPMNQIPTVDELYFGGMNSYAGLHLILKLVKRTSDGLIPIVSATLYSNATDGYSIPRISGDSISFHSKGANMTSIDTTLPITIDLKMKTASGNYIKAFYVNLLAYNR